MIVKPVPQFDEAAIKSAINKAFKGSTVKDYYNTRYAPDVDGCFGKLSIIYGVKSADYNIDTGDGVDSLFIMIEVDINGIYVNIQINASYKDRAVCKRAESLYKADEVLTSIVKEVCRV